ARTELQAADSFERYRYSLVPVSNLTLPANSPLTSTAVTGCDSWHPVSVTYPFPCRGSLLTLRKAADCEQCVLVGSLGDTAFRKRRTTQTKTGRFGRLGAPWHWSGTPHGG